jgi:hypothetical protein
MNIPEHFTPSQKFIVRTYIEVRNVPLVAELTFHKRDSSFVRSVIREYKKFLKLQDSRLHTAA